MSSNALYQSLAAVSFFRRYPITNVSANAPLTPIPAYHEPSAFEKFKRKIGVSAPPPPAVVAKKFKGDPQNAQGMVRKEARIGFGTFSPDAGDPPPLVTTRNCREPTKWVIRLQDPAATGIPVYFLPYNNDENHRTTLVDHQALNAALFATPIVDGCSVYVEGTRAAPTVYHINAVGTVIPPIPGATPGDQQVAKMREAARLMDTRFRGDALKLPGGRANLPKHVKANINLITPGKIEDRDYMIRSPADVQAFQATLPALQAAEKARSTLKGQSVDAMTLMGTKGTVFGVLNGGSWTFYIQRKARVKYFHVPAAGAPVDLGEQWLVRDVIEFWPTVNIGSQLVAAS